MEMRKCDRGHYYDASINNSCPYCKQANVGRPIDATMPLMGGTGEERTMPLGYQAQAEPKGQPEDDGRTVASEKMDICIRGDETISRENQAVITYDSVEKVYYFSPGEGRSIVRLNNKAIFQTTELKAYDRITLGKTVLLFVPLCGENFEWEEE